MLNPSPLLQQFVILSRSMIQKDPGVIVGPITQVLGAIINVVFDFVYQFTVSNSLGISIILLTLIVRVLMLPLAVHQQKSTIKMQKIQPEIEKIKKKYEGRKDTESAQRMNAEMQKLYSDQKINPLSGCLPLFIQMPIFFALSYVMQQSYKFIGVLGELYYKGAGSIAQTIISTGKEVFMPVIWPLAHPKIPNNMEISFVNPEDLAKIFNRFTPSEWTSFLSGMPEATQEALRGLLAQKTQIESFLGINLIDNSVTLSGGLANIMQGLWPGILIPVFTAATTFFSTFMMNRQSKVSDETARMQQKMMLIVMPITMGVMTAGFPAGVGLYWITLNLVQMVQQIALLKYYEAKEKKSAA